MPKETRKTDQQNELKAQDEATSDPGQVESSAKKRLLLLREKSESAQVTRRPKAGKGL